ncbi:hypothetical protein EV426DRAFT_578943 [Tirmania nivea]|nr:hypothetical protein EV426DRAFT_578943 [Tirmania nivea]
MDAELDPDRTPRPNRSESHNRCLPSQTIHYPPVLNDAQPPGTINADANHSAQSSRKRPRVHCPATDTCFPPALSSSTPSSSSNTHTASASIRTGSIAASFTSSAKATIRNAAKPHSGTCFICSSPHTDVAHLIAKSSPSTYLRELRSHGLLPISALGDPQNGILLCPNCHGALDRSPRPDVILLPKDLEWFVEFEERDFAYRNQVWTAEKKAVSRTVPSAEEYRLRCQAISGRTGGGLRCDYGGLYNVYYIRDYHATDPHLLPTAFVGAVQLRTGTGKTAKGWASKQWHGAPVLCILSAGRAIGDLAAIKGVFVTLSELIKMWSREPWTENEDEDGDDSDQGGQDNSHGDTDGTGGAGTFSHSASPPPPPLGSDQARDSNPGSTHQPNSSGQNTCALNTLPNKQYHNPPSPRTKHSYTIRSIPTPPHSFGSNVQEREEVVAEVQEIWPEVYHFGPDSTSEDKVRWVRDILRLYE